MSFTYSDIFQKQNNNALLSCIIKVVEKMLPTILGFKFYLLKLMLLI